MKKRFVIADQWDSMVDGEAHVVIGTVGLWQWFLLPHILMSMSHRARTGDIAYPVDALLAPYIYFCLCCRVRHTSHFLAHTYNRSYTTLFKSMHFFGLPIFCASPCQRNHTECADPLARQRSLLAQRPTKTENHRRSRLP
jgi:hypothetical protein